GDVPSMLALTLGTAGTFGTFVPGVARTYDTSTAATALSTAGNAALSVSDADTAAPGRLVNGAFAISTPVTVRAANAAQPNPPYQPVGATATTLLSYTAPTFGADPVTISFRQALGATEQLRAGNYSKTFTFTLSTTTP